MRPTEPRPSACGGSRRGEFECCEKVPSGRERAGLFGHTQEVLGGEASARGPAKTAMDFIASAALGDRRRDRLRARGGAGDNYWVNTSSAGGYGDDTG